MWEAGFVLQHYKRCFTDPLLLWESSLSVKELVFPRGGAGEEGALATAALSVHPEPGEGWPLLTCLKTPPDPGRHGAQSSRT